LPFQVRSTRSTKVNKWHSIDAALDFAIGEEKAAAKFCTRLADQAKMPGI